MAQKVAFSVKSIHSCREMILKEGIGFIKTGKEYTSNFFT